MQDHEPPEEDKRMPLELLDPVVHHADDVVEIPTSELEAVSTYFLPVFLPSIFRFVCLK